MSRCGRTPLAELLEFVDTELALQCECRVEHSRHMAWVEIETVATCPLGILRVVNHKFREENVDKVGTAHSTTGVTRVGFLYH